MNLRVFDSVPELAAGAAAALVLHLLKAGGGVVSLSGGATPRPIYELLGDGPMREQLAELDTTWVLGDERYVPPDDPQSNAKMIEQSLFRRGVSPKHRFLHFDTLAGEPASSASRFDSQWRQSGVKGIDVAILGVGDDGHTASLFPGTSGLLVHDRVATEVFVPAVNQWRLTLTLPVLQQSPLKYVIAAGGSKRAVIEAVRRGEPLPIAEVTTGSGLTWWFVDKEAWPDEAKS